MYTLYSYPGTCSTGINVLLHQLGLEAEIINPKSVDNYAEISPTRQVPALIDDGLVITEGAAIALHLLRKHGDPVLRASEAEQATFLRWLMFNYATVHPAYSKLFTVKYVMDDGPAKQQLMQQLADGVSDHWAILDNHLEGRTWMHGEKVSLIDYLLAIYSSWNNFFPNAEIHIGPKVRALIDRVTALPEFKAAYASEGIDFKKAA